MNVYKVIVAHEGRPVGAVVVRSGDDPRSLNLAKGGYLRLVGVVDDVVGSDDLAGRGVHGDLDAGLPEAVDEQGGAEPDLSTESVPARRKNGRGRGRKAGTSGEQEGGSEEPGAPVWFADSGSGSEAGGLDPDLGHGGDAE